MADNWSPNEYEFDPNDQRFERKFVTDALSAPDLDTMLRVHPYGFRIAYPDRWINNFYLDTENLTCYTDHTRGCRSRAKFRVRWYGDLLQKHAKPVLEIKRKVGMVGSKIRFDLPEFDSTKGFYDDALKNLILEAGIDERIGGWVKTMRFVVGNRYRRTYFVTLDSEFRMTIDRDLQFIKIPSRLGAPEEPIEESTIVLELKYQNELDEKVAALTQQLPVRVGRMSKYILGVERLAANGGW
jgi:SPX domain protein involved in polyphosphate accumulation